MLLYVFKKADALKMERNLTSRRVFLKKAATFAAVSLLTQNIPDTIKHASQETLKLGSHNLGININKKAFLNYGFNADEGIDILLSLPLKHVRIPIPFDEVHPSENSWNFDNVDRLIDKALTKGKVIDLQQGIKTIGFPEAHIRGWTNKYPHLKQIGVQLNINPYFNEEIFKYNEKVAKRFYNISEIASIQVENEPFSRIDVAGYRYITFEFNTEEIKRVKEFDYKNRPFVQNIPWEAIYKNPSRENFKNIIKILQSPQIDILGLNVYNNTEDPESTHWFLIDVIFRIASFYGKLIKITEYQSAPWINDDMEPLYQFSSDRFFEGLNKLLHKNPHDLAFWDLEQHIKWASLGNPESIMILKFIQNIE